MQIFTQMEHKTLRQFILIPLFGILVLSASAQITIGDVEPPASGALLDLKENGQTTKGLGLPRVKLMVRSGDLSTTMDEAPGKYTGDHTGLLVYNVNECMSGGDGSGIYVWNGSVWDNLTGSNDVVIQTYYDQEGKPFRARNFGSYYNQELSAMVDVGTWMVENLAVNTYGSKQGGGSLVGPKTVNTADTKRWAYPGLESFPSTLPAGMQGVKDGTDPYFYNRQLDLGYLYNWPAATNGKVASSSANEIGTNEATRIQGICPDGWHLPSDKEWTDLENVIITNTSKFADMPDIVTQMIYNTAVPMKPNGSYELWQGTHGQAMKSKCVAESSTRGATNGKSFFVINGGINLFLSGYGGGELGGYGNYSTFWTSSAYTNSRAYARQVFRQSDAVNKYHTQLNGMYSIRCKKD